MITLNIITEETDFGVISKSERELTPEESETVTSSVSDGTEGTIIYYQGDEPKT